MTAAFSDLTLFETGAYKGRPRARFGAGAARPPVRDKASPAHPDDRAASSGVDVGAGWITASRATGDRYTALTIAHPDIGPRAYRVNLGRAADQDDDNVFAMIWNWRDPNPAARPRRPARGLARPATDLTEDTKNAPARGAGARRM